MICIKTYIGIKIRYKVTEKHKT